MEQKKSHPTILVVPFFLYLNIPYSFFSYFWCSKFSPLCFSFLRFNIPTYIKTTPLYFCILSLEIPTPLFFCILGVSKFPPLIFSFLYIGCLFFYIGCLKIPTPDGVTSSFFTPIPLHFLYIWCHKIPTPDFFIFVTPPHLNSARSIVNLEPWNPRSTDPKSAIRTQMQNSNPHLPKI